MSNNSFKGWSVESEKAGYRQRTVDYIYYNGRKTTLYGRDKRGNDLKTTLFERGKRGKPKFLTREVARKLLLKTYPGDQQLAPENPDVVAFLELVRSHFVFKQYLNFSSNDFCSLLEYSEVRVQNASTSRANSKSHSRSPAPTAQSTSSGAQMNRLSPSRSPPPQERTIQNTASKESVTKRKLTSSRSPSPPKKRRRRLSRSRSGTPEGSRSGATERSWTPLSLGGTTTVDPPWTQEFVR